MKQVFLQSFDMCLRLRQIASLKVGWLDGQGQLPPGIN